MPFFSLKKSKKKVPIKAASMGNIYRDYGGTGNEEYFEKDMEQETAPVESTMTSEHWRERRISGSSIPVDSRITELKVENEKLKHQNDLLTLKVEILLDMIAQKTAEADILHTDMEKMKKILLKVEPPKSKVRS